MSDSRIIPIANFMEPVAQAAAAEPIRAIMTSLREELLAKIAPEQIAKATAMLKAKNLPEESAACFSKIEFRTLEAYFAQDCDKCGGNREDCEKLTAHVDANGIVYFEKEPCAKRIALENKRKVAKFLKASGVPYIFQGLRAGDFHGGNDQVLDAAEAAIFDGKSVYIYGDAGSGKTKLASIIANERAYQMKPSLFVSIAETLETLREFNNPTSRINDGKTREEKLRKYASAKCLIADDIGAEKPTEWVIETLFKIFNRRYNDGLQNIATSNLSPADLEDHIGSRVARRILHGAEIVRL